MDLDASGNSLREVIEWGLRQAVYLSPPQQSVLMYLVVNAFLTDDNPEDSPAGQVLRGRSNVPSIRRYTSLGDKTVRRALQDLQDKGYVVCVMGPGRAPNRILVLWSGKMDTVRENFRSGAEPLPHWMRRPETRRNSLPKVETEGNVLRPERWSL